MNERRLTAGQVQAARVLSLSGVPSEAIAGSFDTTPEAVERIVQGEDRREVPVSPREKALRVAAAPEPLNRLDVSVWWGSVVERDRFLSLLRGSHLLFVTRGEEHALEVGSGTGDVATQVRRAVSPRRRRAIHPRTGEDPAREVRSRAPAASPLPDQARDRCRWCERDDLLMLDDWILESLAKDGPATARGLATRLDLGRAPVQERLAVLESRFLQTVQTPAKETIYRALPRVPLDFEELDAWIVEHLAPGSPPPRTRYARKKDPARVASGKASVQARARKKARENGE